MTATQMTKLSASLSAVALALGLGHPSLAEDAQQEAAHAAAPAEQPAATTTAPAQHPGQAAREAMEERRAAHLAELEKRHEELREQAAIYDFEMPPAPPWTESPQWLSFEEMQERMKARGIEIQAPPSGAAPTPPPVPAPPMAMGDPEEQKRIFDTIGNMTPEQQKACFALSRWHTPRIPRRMPPGFNPPRMPQYPPGYAPQSRQPHPGMMPPR